MGIIIFFFVSVVLDRMTQLSVEERIEAFFAKDWKAEAEKVIATDSTLKPLPQVMLFFLFFFNPFLLGHIRMAELNFLI